MHVFFLSERACACPTSILRALVLFMLYVAMRALVRDLNRLFMFHVTMHALVRDLKWLFMFYVAMNVQCSACLSTALKCFYLKVDVLFVCVLDLVAPVPFARPWPSGGPATRLRCCALPVASGSPKGSPLRHASARASSGGAYCVPRTRVQAEHARAALGLPWAWACPAKRAAPNRGRQNAPRHQAPRQSIRLASDWLGTVGGFKPNRAALRPAEREGLGAPDSATAATTASPSHLMVASGACGLRLWGSL